MGTMPRKGYGRIYTETQDQVDAVRAIIREMDSFEFGYLKDDFVAPFSEYPNVVYTGKFDALEMNDLTAVCWLRGIKIFALNNGHEEYVNVHDLAKRNQV